MKKIILSLSFFLTLLFVSCSSRKEEPKIVIFQDFNATELLLNWFDNGMPESEIENVANTPGMVLMGQNALKQEELTEPVFADALRQFRLDTTSVDIYGIAEAYKNRKAIRELSDLLEDNNICDSAIAYAATFIPKEHIPQFDFSAYFVPTGWSYGDAYIRNVIQEGNSYSLSSDGNPTSFFNLKKISIEYGSTAKEQMEMLKGVMAHEMFHVLFSNYKQQSTNYQKINANDIGNQLLGLIHDEGIAHYICYRNDMKNDFSSFEPFQQKSFETLNDAVNVLRADTTSLEIKEELLFKANVGNFWDKYGSIAGMFMAYHIENELGFDALVETVRTGDIGFIETYHEACNKNTTLPIISTMILK